MSKHTVSLKLMRIVSLKALVIHTLFVLCIWCFSFMWPNDVILSLFKCQLIWREKQLWLSWGFHDFRRIFWIVSILLQEWLYLYIWWCISNVIKFWYTHFHFSIKKISFLSISLSLSLSLSLCVLLSSSLFFFFIEFSL